jgi:hypothetical protein
MTRTGLLSTVALAATLIGPVAMAAPAGDAVTQWGIHLRRDIASLNHLRQGPDGVVEAGVTHRSAIIRSQREPETPA